MHFNSYKPEERRNIVLNQESVDFDIDAARIQKSIDNINAALPVGSSLRASITPAFIPREHLAEAAARAEDTWTLFLMACGFYGAKVFCQRKDVDTYTIQVRWN